MTDLHAQEAEFRARARRNGKPDDVGESLGAVPDYPVEVLPVAARSLVRCGTDAGLPAALLGGAALAAMATALGPGPQFEVTPKWHERAILWVPLLAPRGAGKSPAQELAFGPLRDHDAQLDEDDQGEVRFGDLTLEALARCLHGANGAGALDLDELAVMLRGFGEYKRGGGGDRGRFLALWSGAPWAFTRVGGGDKTNKMRLRISRPTLVICGGLQPALHELLGGEEDGLRPRWLPHLAGTPATTGELGHGPRPERLAAAARASPSDETPLAADLAARRRGPRRLPRTPQTLESHCLCVRVRLTSAALVKADVHLARVALVLAEATSPGAGGEVGASIVHRAARLIDFTLDCWRALPEQGGLALSRVDWQLDRSIDRLVAWLEERGGAASRRELRRARVAGVRTSSDLDALLRRYEARFPATVVEERPEQGGIPTVVVKAPKRRPIPSVSPIGDTDNGRPKTRIAKAESVASPNCCKWPGPSRARRRFPQVRQRR
jgi:hypothetical protein